MFGGLTGLLLVPLGGLFGNFFSDESFAISLLAVWGVCFIAPPVIVFMTRPTRILIVVMLINQLVFSGLQAAIGILVVIGKDV